MRALAILLITGTAAAQPTPPHPDHDQGPPPAPPPLFSPVPRTFFSVAIGGGGGVLGGETEALEADVKGGPQWAPMHLRIELGAFRNPRWAFAIAARLGFTFADVGDPPASKAVMLRIYKMCDPLGLRFNGAIGAGYIRYRVGVEGDAHDTMAAGPLLVGGGVGYVHKLSKSWRVVADANVLGAIASSDNYGGVPNEHALHFELDIGLAVFR